MANQRRGEIEAELGGRIYTLVLTLGALAELETKFRVGDLAGLAQRFETGRVSARDLHVIIACGLRGGGAMLSDEEVARLTVPDGLKGYVQIVAQLLAATFGGDAESTTAFPPGPQDT